jgi:glycosyltransferase involved in cell wall biosynthesis
MLSSPAWTGPAEPMASLAGELRARGHEIQVAVDTRRPGDLRERLQALGFAVRADLALTTRGAPPPFLADARTLGRIGSGFDVVHAHFSNDHAAALVGLRRRRERPRLVRTVHSERSLRARLLQRLAYQRTDGVIAVCEAHARVLASRFGVPEERLLAIRGAVDCHAFRPDGPDLRAELGLAPGQPVAGIVSRVKPGRRHGELVAAFRGVVRRIPEARLVVVGRGEGLEALREHLARTELAGRVLLAGYRTGPELAAAYRTLDVKVLLAEGNDGTCRALLEAMACGRAAVAYRFGAPAETIEEGATGLLVDDGDVAGLERALAELLSDPARARAMGAAGRARAAALYTHSAQGDAVERFFGRLLDGPAAVL